MSAKYDAFEKTLPIMLSPLSLIRRLLFSLSVLP